MRVVLTGRAREVDGSRNARMSKRSRQYRCLDCGCVGWSRHVDLEWLDHTPRREE